MFPGTGSKKQQPKGLKRLPPLKSTGKRLLLGVTPVLGSGVSPYLTFAQEGLAYP